MEKHVLVDNAGQLHTTLLQWSGLSQAVWYIVLHV